MIAAKLPWKVFFNRAIYGVSDTPNGCLPNKGPDGFTSKPFFSSSIVAPGEIDDRFRNSNRAQGIGYSMGTLGMLAEMAELLRNAGFNAYGYRGVSGCEKPRIFGGKWGAEIRGSFRPPCAQLGGRIQKGMSSSGKSSEPASEGWPVT